MRGFERTTLMQNIPRNVADPMGSGGGGFRGRGGGLGFRGRGGGRFGGRGMGRGGMGGGGPEPISARDPRNLVSYIDVDEPKVSSPTSDIYLGSETNNRSGAVIVHCPCGVAGMNRKSPDKLNSPVFRVCTSNSTCRNLLLIWTMEMLSPPSQRRRGSRYEFNFENRANAKA